MKIIYNIIISLYGFTITLASLFNPKAKKWKSGRKNIFANLEKAFAGVKEPVAWFHCSSLGEFEQGRPVIEAFRQAKPGYKILLTFFSPSGFEVRKEYTGADFVFYLPLDTPANAKRFVQIVNPALSVFVKYEFWFNYLQELHKADVPVYLISAKFRADQYFFKGYGSWFRKQLKEYRKIFVQDAASESLLKGVGITNVQVAGDSRFDRVIGLSELYSAPPTGHAANTATIIKEFKRKNLLWICGSTWDEDDKLISKVFKQLTAEGLKIKLLIVPHEVDKYHIERVLKSFPGASTYMGTKPKEASFTNVMIVDTIGLLSSLYQYGDIAYVGGGFGKGIHNLPEAAVYGIPVLFGPNYQKFNEAFELINCKGGVSVANSDELYKRVSHLLTDDAFRKQCGDSAKNYIYSARGATNKIVAELILL